MRPIPFPPEILAPTFWRYFRICPGRSESAWLLGREIRMAQLWAVNNIWPKLGDVLCCSWSGEKDIRLITFDFVSHTRLLKFSHAFSAVLISNARQMLASSLRQRCLLFVTLCWILNACNPCVCLSWMASCL